MDGGKLSVAFPNYHHTTEIAGGKLVEVNTRSYAFTAETLQCDDSCSAQHRSEIITDHNAISLQLGSSFSKQEKLSQM